MIKKGFGQVLSEADFLSLKSGQHKGFNAAYSLYSDHVFSLCLHLVNNEQLAADLLQDVFETLLVKCDKLNNRLTLGGWLKKSSINACLMTFRKNKLENTLLNKMNEEITYSVEKSEINEHITYGPLNRSLNKLPLLSRAVIYLFAIKDLKHSEIAPQLEIKESSSRQIYHRALKQLRNWLS